MRWWCMAKPEPTSNAIPHLTNEPLFSHGDTKNTEILRCAKCRKTAPSSPLHYIPCVSVPFFYAPPSPRVGGFTCLAPSVVKRSDGLCLIQYLTFNYLCACIILFPVEQYVCGGFVPCYLERYSMSSGTLFQLIWTIVPSHLEQHGNC